MAASRSSRLWGLKQDSATSTSAFRATLFTAVPAHALSAMPKGSAACTAASGEPASGAITISSHTPKPAASPPSSPLRLARGQYSSASVPGKNWAAAMNAVKPSFSTDPSSWRLIESR